MVNTKTKKMLNPPIARMGGKSKLRKRIIELIPEHTTYIEPFFGAGWVYFGKEPSKVEVINDIDSELVNMFQMIKHHAPEIERIMEYDFHSRDLFQLMKKSDIEMMTQIQRAARYMLLARMSYANKMGNYGYSPSSKPRSIHRDLSWISNRLANTYVENLPYEKLIKKYDRETAFIFADPPYLGTCLKFSEIDIVFAYEEHKELKNILETCKGKFLLTINDCNEVRELYKGYNIQEVNVSYTVGKNDHIGKELIITNY